MYIARNYAMFSDIQIVCCKKIDCWLLVGVTLANAISYSSVMNQSTHCQCMIGAGDKFENRLKYQCGTIMQMNSS